MMETFCDDGDILRYHDGDMETDIFNDGRRLKPNIKLTLKSSSYSQYSYKFHIHKTNTINTPTIAISALKYFNNSSTACNHNPILLSNYNLFP